MKTNIFKIIFTALLAHIMCATVVLAHLHAKDAVSLANQQNIANAKIITSTRQVSRCKQLTTVAPRLVFVNSNPC